MRRVDNILLQACLAQSERPVSRNTYATPTATEMRHAQGGQHPAAGLPGPERAPCIEEHLRNSNSN